jgi:hypothetical protein
MVHTVAIYHKRKFIIDHRLRRKGHTYTNINIQINKFIFDPEGKCHSFEVDQPCPERVKSNNTTTIMTRFETAKKEEKRYAEKLQAEK